MKLFAPQATTTQAATTAASTAKLIPGTRGQGGAYAVRIYNDGTTLGYIAFGDSSVAATTSDLPIPSALPCGFTIANPAKSPATHFSVIMASGTATFSVTTGDGI
jgi:hypothetical protein